MKLKLNEYDTERNYQSLKVYNKLELDTLDYKNINYNTS